MQLTKWEPFGGFTSFRREMDRLFDSFFDRQSSLPSTGNEWTPRFDMIESIDAIDIKADIPGMSEKDISVSLSGDNLIIKGERKTEKEEKDKQFHRIERSFGAFQRIIALPVTVDSKSIKAEYNKGVLELYLPKKPEAKPKEITITVNK